MSYAGLGGVITPCRRCQKDRDLYSRGLCSGCYQYCRKKVLSGKTTWEVLVRQGWALERAAVGRPNEGPDIDTMNSEAFKGIQKKEMATPMTCSCGSKFNFPHESLDHRRQFLGQEGHVITLDATGTKAGEITDELLNMANLLMNEEKEKSLE